MSVTLTKPQFFATLAGSAVAGAAAVCLSRKLFGLKRKASTCCAKSPAGASKNAQVVFVLGGPGAGKGTQCGKIVDRFGFVHLSAGDLLRAERKRESKHAQLINTYIQEGKIVPVEITVQLIRNAMEQHMQSGKANFLVDGFPRNENNLQGWNDVMSDFATVPLVLFYDCSEDVMKARLLNRGKTSGRKDDNADAIIKRFRTYREESMPIIEHFLARGICKQIDATGPVDLVFDETEKAINGIL